MTVKGGTTPACAACKYQRRRCTPECLLAPYFPANDTENFRNVHRLYGVSNVLKILKQLNGSSKDEAMRSIKYESAMRKKFPVYGCEGVITQLNREKHYLELELQRIHQQLQFHRDKNQLRQNNNNNASSSSSSDDSSSSNHHLHHLEINQQQQQQIQTTPPPENFLQFPQFQNLHEYGHYYHDSYNIGGSSSGGGQNLEIDLPFYNNLDMKTNNNDFTVPNAFRDLQNEISYHIPMTHDMNFSYSDEDSRLLASSSRESELTSAAANLTLDNQGSKNETKPT